MRKLKPPEVAGGSYLSLKDCGVSGLAPATGGGYANQHYDGAHRSSKAAHKCLVVTQRWDSGLSLFRFLSGFCWKIFARSIAIVPRVRSRLAARSRSDDECFTSTGLHRARHYFINSDPGGPDFRSGG